MGALESNTTLVYGIHLRESANDGSDFSNAAADYRVFFLGEDGLVHVKDSAGAVTSPYASAAPSAHACKVHRASGDVSVGNNTLTVIGWDAEDHDTDSMHDNSSNNSRIVIPAISGVTTGLWSMAFKGYSNATSGRTDVSFFKNANGSSGSGTQIGLTPGGAVLSGLNTVVAQEDAVLTAGDYIEVFMRTTGGSFSLKFDSVTLPVFSVTFLGKVT